MKRNHFLKAVIIKKETYFIFYDVLYLCFSNIQIWSNASCCFTLLRALKDSDALFESKSFTFCDIFTWEALTNEW